MLCYGLCITLFVGLFCFRLVCFVVLVVLFTGLGWLLWFWVLLYDGFGYLNGGDLFGWCFVLLFCGLCLVVLFGFWFWLRFDVGFEFGCIGVFGLGWGGWWFMLFVLGLLRWWLVVICFFLVLFYYVMLLVVCWVGWLVLAGWGVVGWFFVWIVFGGG